VSAAASRHPPSLLRLLLLRLMAPLLAIVAVTGALGLATAQRLTDRTFDRWLLDAARALVGQVRFDDGRARVRLGGDAQAILEFDVVDRINFSVVQGDRLVAGQAGIPRQGERTLRYPDGETFDAVYQGRPVRVAAVDVGSGTGRVTALVAETLAKRDAARRDLRLMLLPLGVLMIAAAAAIVLALRWTLRPLQAIAERWNAQSHASLLPIASHDVPRELLPFAQALNDLLDRIAQMLARERRFVSNAAHQIRTPLAGLQLGLSRAAEAPDLARARAVIAELQRTTQRTARLLQQLLLLGRLDPEAAKELPREPVDLAALAHQVGESELDTALARRIDLEFDAPPQPVTVTAHADLVGEALANLVDNALRYTPEGGMVLITVRPGPPTVAVDDSGPGIAASERATVFERFVRGRQAGAWAEGSGLGLAIVREIAELHGATVAIDDSALGGARVEMRFAEGQAAG
jgi:two-component system sensor histidine kinase TctE